MKNAGDGRGNGCTTTRMVFMPQNGTLKYDLTVNFMLCIFLAQLKNTVA
jgi:hypothetical protein